MSDQRWVSAHVFYHGDLDTVLLRMVAPLVQELAQRGHAERYFFVRHWDGGPHLRLRILPRGDYHPTIERQVRERAADLFRTWPAEDGPDRSAYQVRAAQLARLEGVRAYSPRLRENNSIAMIPYRAEYQRFGAGEVMSAVERHFATCSRIAMELLTAGPSPRHRTTAAFSLILLAWFACERVGPPVPVPWRGAAATMVGTDEPAAALSFDSQRETLRSIAQRVHKLAASPRATGTGMLGRWLRSIAGLRRMIPDPHTYLRVADTCAHLACNRIGISIGEEGRLRYLAERTLRTYECAGGPAHVA